MCPCPPPTSLNLALTTVSFIFSVPTVVLPVTAEDAGDTAVGVGALELTGQADVNVWEWRRAGLRAGGGPCPSCGRGGRGWTGPRAAEMQPREKAAAGLFPCSHCGRNDGRLGRSLPQLASSLLSWQSLSPSQMKAGLVQMPVEHWNWPGRHLNSAAKKEGLVSKVEEWVSEMAL